MPHKQRQGLAQTYLRWLSVSVMPWSDTLKWTVVAVDLGGVKMALEALEIAWGPVRDSVSTEPR